MTKSVAGGRILLKSCGGKCRETNQDYVGKTTRTPPGSASRLRSSRQREPHGTEARFPAPASADTKTPLEYLKDVVSQLKEMHHYAKNNVERLTAQWLMFDDSLLIQGLLPRQKCLPVGHSGFGASTLKQWRPAPWCQRASLSAPLTLVSVANTAHSRKRRSANGA